MQVNDAVRNIKTRSVGNIDSLEGDSAWVRGEDGVAHTYRLADLEPLNLQEYELVKTLVKAKAGKKEAAELSKAADSAAAEAEDKLVEYLRKNSLESTKNYDGLGVAVIDGMKVMPSITEENREAAFKAIREMGRGEIIKEQIHSATLTAFVGELLDVGKVPVPASIGYFLKPKLAVRKK